MPTSKEGGARRQASPKVLAGAAVALVAVGLGVALAVALTSGGSSSASVPERGSLVNGVSGAREVEREFKGIPQQGRVLGKTSAPVTLVEYIDLQCPFCRDFHANVLPPVIERYVRTGKLKIDMRPIAFIGPDSERGRNAILAAGEQGRLFNLLGLFYFSQGAENGGWLTDDLVEAAAASIPGLDVPALLAARDSDEVDAAATEVDGLAGADNVQGTPTVFVGRSDGALTKVELASASDPQQVLDAIESALR